MKSNTSIKKQIFVWMILVSSISLAIITIQGLHCAKQAVMALQFDHLNSIVGVNKNIIEQWIADREQDIRLLSHSAIIQKAVQLNSKQASHEEAEDLLNQTQSERPFFESIVIYDSSWRKIAQTQEISHKDDDLLDKKIIDQLKRSNEFILNTPHLHEDGNIGLHIGYPFTNELGKKVGYVIYNLSLTETVQSIIIQPNIHQQDPYNSYLLSKEGVYICLPQNRKEYLGKKSLFSESMLSGLMEDVVEYRNYLGEDVLGLSTVIPSTNWILISEIRKDQAFEWISVLGYRALVTGLVTLVIIAYLSIRISGKISKPMRELAETAREVAIGNTSLRVEPAKGREAYELAEAFNQMLDELAVANKQLVQTASLAAVGKLSASVVHEMRNPLSTIKMNLQALQKKVEGDPNHSELGSLAFRQTERLEQMLTDLLNYGKPIELELSQVNLKELVIEVTTIIQPKANAKEIQIDFTVNNGSKKIIGDPEQLRRVLINLIENAIHACDRGGLVRISSTLKDLDINYISISIADTGPGIPENKKEDVFRPFYTTQEGGTGLGLAIVKKIVDLHGGMITLSNRAGGGTVFTIKLPYEGNNS